MVVGQFVNFGGNPDGLADEDLVIAAETMKGHLDLMRGPSHVDLSPEEQIGISIAA